jgi:mono/diheme cytochrome c family protein
VRFPRPIPRSGLAGLAGLLGTFAALAAEPTPEAIRQLPPAATRKVDFIRDVQPILDASCVKCHGRGKSKGGWRLDTRADVLGTADSGPAVVLGSSERSHLIHLVAGTDPDSVMPEKGKRLTPEEVGILRAWIDQGLGWDVSVTFAKPPVRNLDPRMPELPKGRAKHPLDRFLEAYGRQRNWTPPKPVEDRLFARRVYLDTVGMLPGAEELDAFQRSRSPDKRAQLVRTLLSDRQRYAQHWLTFWNDLLRNDYKGTGYIDGGRKQISRWLYTALRDNTPYDRFVRELVDPGEGSEGFTKGIVWRGTVNASMTPSMQAAQNIGQVLMGVNLKCASCHDSFIDDWQLGDAYGLAGIYADGPLEMVLCDRPTGKTAPLKFLFPELGAVDPKAPRPERLRQLAGIITRKENGRLSRTVVNRLWARLLGRGLVEPLDVMQNAAWDPDLLDWLAEDLVAHGWDLKRTLELILTSRAYQLPSVDLPEKPGPDDVFTGPGIRRLTAEQFRDALGSLTGVWQERPEGGLDRLLLEGTGTAVSSTEAFWIWGDPHGATGVPPGTNGFLRSLVLPAVPTEATFFVHVDNSARVFVNGERLRGVDASDWSQSGIYDARSRLKAGTNWIAVEAVNGGDGPNPAGLLLHARIRTADRKGERVHDLATDAAWMAVSAPTGEWTRGGTTTGWKPAQVLGGASLAPWNVADALATAVAGRSPYGRVRTSLTSADPLQLALGRPNREQVTTVRQSIATTLQALELTNGETLSKILQQGAGKLVEKHSDGRTLVEQVFRQALSRPPTREELRVSLGLVGSRPQKEGVEDFLWSVAMLPEFQLTL